MTVEVGISLVVLDAILRNLRVSPYNRDGALFPFLLGMLLAPSRGGENANVVSIGWLDSGCVVYSNSLIPGPEMTEMTGFMTFRINSLICINFLPF